MTDPDHMITSEELVRQARRELASADLLREARRELGLERTTPAASPNDEPEQEQRREREASPPDLSALTELRRRTTTVIDAARDKENERRAQREPPGVEEMTHQGPLGRPSNARGVRGLIVIGAAVAAAIALLGSFTSVSVDSGPVDPPVVVTAAAELEVGTCLQQPDGFIFEDVATVSCNEPHDFEVIGHVLLDGASYPGDEAVYEVAFDRCLPVFESYVGTSYDTSIWWLNAFTPTLDGWNDGDRLATCLVLQYTSDDEILRVTRSARNDGR